MGKRLHELLKKRFKPKCKKCIVKNCTNKSNEGIFIGGLCGPCYEFITQGKGNHSQMYRNCLCKKCKQLDELKETCEIISNQKTVRDLKISLDQIKQGKVVCLKCIYCKRKI